MINFWISFDEKKKKVTNISYNYIQSFWNMIFNYEIHWGVDMNKFILEIYHT